MDYIWKVHDFYKIAYSDNVTVLVSGFNMNYTKISATLFLALGIIHMIVYLSTIYIITRCSDNGGTKNGLVRLAVTVRCKATCLLRQQQPVQQQQYTVTVLQETKPAKSTSKQ